MTDALSSRVRRGARAVLANWQLAVLIYAVVFVIPAFDPTYPASGVDPSWHTALNEAVARHLVFGRDVVFTYGPYAAANTREYHPELPWLGIGGGLLLALGYVGAILVLLVGRHRWTALGLAVVLLAGLASFDALALAYPLVVVLALHHLVTRSGDAPWPARDRMWLVLLMVPVGLLPLVKLSSTPTAAAGLVAASALLLLHRRWLEAVLCWVVPALTLPVLWWAAGQPIGALADYVVTSLPTIAGYSRAMTRPGNDGQLFLFLFAVLVAVITLLVRSRVAILERLILTAMVVATLFVALKAGFVRHDEHVLIVVFPLILTGLAVASYLSQRGPQVVVVAVCLLVAVPLYLFNVPGHDGVPAKVWHSATSGPVGLVERVTDRGVLDQRYERARARLRDQGLVPAVPAGTDVDLYPIELSDLLAQDVDWNPRPMFQSYGAYTPRLQELNADHLTGADAPDTILFAMEPIDGRLPSLEDGPSWLPLLERYDVTSRDADNDYLVLQRRATPLELREPGRAVHLSGTFGQDLELPVHAGGLWAGFDVQPSLRGQLRNLVWKTPPLQIVLTLEDGRERGYRFVPDMARNGFVLSPLVRDVDDYTGLVAADATADGTPAPRVRAIRLQAPAPGNSRLWQSRYTVELTGIDVSSSATSDRRARPGSPTG